jgi:PilZ domain
MTASDRRHSPRFNPQGLKASIILEYPQDSTDLEGEVVDISLTGVKIKLNSPMPLCNDSKIRINFLLPESGIPFSISGILKHQLNSTELGLHYTDNRAVQLMDNFMLECIKLVKN